MYKRQVYNREDDRRIGVISKSTTSAHSIVNTARNPKWKSGCISDNIIAPNPDARPCDVATIGRI